MFFSQRVVDNSQSILAEKIKRDLIMSLQKKGINIDKVQVDMKSGNLNLEVLVRENK